MSLKYEVIRIGGNLVYHRHGGRHRVDGPASIWDDEDLYWMRYDILHRENGPANVFKHETFHYYIKGEQYSKKDYELKIRSY